jgi:hypothetical protein
MHKSRSFAFIIATFLHFLAIGVLVTFATYTIAKGQHGSEYFEPNTVSPQPKFVFTSGASSVAAGQEARIEVQVDSNGGSLGKISAFIRFDPILLSIVDITAAPDLCTSPLTIWPRFDEEIMVSCLAPSGGLAKQVNPFFTITAKPLTSQNATITLFSDMDMGRSMQYSVIHVLP